MKFLCDLIYNYLNNNKSIFLFILINFLSLFLEVIVSSKIYVKFFEKDIMKKFNQVIYMICTVWISIYILYYIGRNLEIQITCNFREYIRRELILNYLNTNEISFNDKEIEKDNLKLLDVGYFIDFCFRWVCKTLIPTFMLIVIMNIYFFIKSPILGVLQFISNLINYFIIKNYYQDIYDRMLKRRESHDLLSMNLTEIITNLINIYMLGNIDNSINKNDKFLSHYRDDLKCEFNIIYEFIDKMKLNLYIFSIMSIFFLYKSSQSIKDFLDIFSIFILYIPVFKNTIDKIPEKINIIGDIFIILNDLVKSKKLTDKSDIEEIYNNYKKNNIDSSGDIIIDNISYSYDNDSDKNDKENTDNMNSDNKRSNIFSDFSLTIKKHERVGIMSHSGRGKTTLAKLLLNFIKPQKGGIYYDGFNINEINHRALRKRIMYVNQRTILLNDTIINNLKYGNNKSKKEILYLLEKYGLDKILPDVEKMVDMNGRNISLGMQKVIYIVRSILKDDCYAYIFDEPLTSLDQETRSSIIKMIDENTRGKTVIIITHDNEITSILDRIISI
jgi:ABC-type multidrug transport system fused ATPase/permease subunit